MQGCRETSSWEANRHAAFQPTQWNVVLRAQDIDSPEGREAMSRLYCLYRHPIYAYLRRCGHDPQSARDLAQGFFAYLLEKSLVRKATPEKGRFRSFMLGSLKHYVRDQWRHDQCQKRGGTTEMVSLEELEDRYASEQTDRMTPEKVFDYRCATAVLDEAWRRLASEFAAAGAEHELAALRPFLVGGRENRFAALAKELKKSEEAARTQVGRLRRRYRELVQQVIGETVSDPGMVPDELTYLKEALRSR